MKCILVKNVTGISCVRKFPLLENLTVFEYRGKNLASASYAAKPLLTMAV